MISSADQTILQTTTGQKTKPRWPQTNTRAPLSMRRGFALALRQETSTGHRKRTTTKCSLTGGLQFEPAAPHACARRHGVCVSTRPVGCVVSRKGYLLNRFKPLIQQSRAPHDESMIPSPARAVSSILPSSASISNPCCHPSPPILLNVE